MSLLIGVVYAAALGASALSARVTTRGLDDEEPARRGLSRLATLGTLVIAIVCAGRVAFVLTDVPPHALRDGVDLLVGVLTLGIAARIGPMVAAVESLQDRTGQANELVEALAGALPRHVDAARTLDDARLTRREQEVLDLLGTGVISDAEIAAALHVSPATAGTHVRNILRKTQLSSRQHLLLLQLDARGSTTAS